MTDSYIKLIYLRSRYYAPETGRFTTRDTWRGDYTRPLSLNRWNYVESNPVMFTDPSGLKVKREGVLTGDFIYSCNCGWLDSHHADPGTTKSILNLLRIKVDPPAGMQQDKRVLQLVINTWVPAVSFENRFVIKIDPVSNNKSLALGILMAHENKRESLQGTPGIRWIGGSYYSEEDLTSNLIGYYMAINDKLGLREDDGFNWLVPICKVPPTRQEAIDWSTKVFDEYGDSVEKWEKWANPRLLCTSTIDSFCGDEPRSWPSQFSIDTAAQPGDDWWEYSFWSDGFLRSSDVNDNIFYLWPSFDR